MRSATSGKKRQTEMEEGTQEEGNQGHLMMLTCPKEKAGPEVYHSLPALSTRQSLRQERGTRSHLSLCLQRPHPSPQQCYCGQTVLLGYTVLVVTHVLVF